jgi:hypothetical protein
LAKGRRALAEQMRRRDEEDRRRYDQAFAAAREPSKAEQQREAERAAYFEWKAKGDYRTPPPSLIGVNYGPQAEERRRLERTALPTGAGAMGAAYASPTALALNKDYISNVNAENDALAYQGALAGEDMYQRTNNSALLMQSDFARRMGLLSNATSQSQFQTGARIQTTPQSLWPALISGGLAAAGGFLGGPAFAAMMGGGGGAAGAGRT